MNVLIVSTIIAVFVFVIKMGCQKDNYEKKRKKDQLHTFSDVMNMYNSAAESLFKLLNKMKLVWWPTEGTLIGILRYGGNFGNYPTFGTVGTDTDIDIMIQVESEQEWEDIVKKIRKNILELKDFNTCNLTRASVWLPNDTSNYEDKMTCHTIHDKYQGYIGLGLYTDIHRYIVNKKENYAYTQPNYLKQSYPFQYWNGKIPYKGMIVDENGNFGKCKFNSLTLPCPYKAIEILQHWNNREYTAGELRYPYGGIYYKNDKLQVSETGPSLELSKKDKEYLHKLWKKLKKDGYTSFSE